MVQRRASQVYIGKDVSYGLGLMIDRLKDFSEAGRDCQLKGLNLVAEIDMRG
jgi:hypothetical protein